MLLSVLVFVLIAAIVFYQVIQGLFSATIMAILSILAMALAFTYYEPLAVGIWKLSDLERNPMYLYPAALMAIFFLSLLSMRIVMDRLVAQNMVMGVWADRIGGGAVGLVTALVIVGMLTICMQMLPFNSSIMGYKPFDDSLKRAGSIAIFKPDDFVLGFVQKLSIGSLSSGTTAFRDVHDNYLLELQTQRTRLNTDSRNEAKPDALAIGGLYQLAPTPSWLNLDNLPRNGLLEPRTITNTFIVRTVIPANWGDPDGWFRLPAGQFRLTTDFNRSYYPIAFLTNGPVRDSWKHKFVPVTVEKNQVAQIAKIFVERRTDKGPSLVVDWIYTIPANEKPQSVIFRRVARARLPEPLTVLPNGFAESALQRTP